MNALKKKVYTDFLIPRMSFLIGMGSVFNIAGSYYKYNTSEAAKEADEKAISKDWQMIEQDFQDILEEEDLLDKIE